MKLNDEQYEALRLCRLLQNDVAKIEYELARARENRNEAILQAIALGVPQTQIANHLNLTLQGVTKIRRAADERRQQQQSKGAPLKIEIFSEMPEWPEPEKMPSVNKEFAGIRI